VKVNSSQGTAAGKVLYANSITLTPGTITLDVQGSTILVHALTEASAQGVENGEMDRRVSRLEHKD
jgi:multicomponent Na+:H+ antiporter subunit E